MDLAIWATRQPTTAAAWAAVRVASGISITVSSSPQSARARCTRAALALSSPASSTASSLRPARRT
jgi:hypothetical protein